MTRTASAVAALGLAAVALLVASCSVQVENRQPARELAREQAPQGSVYLGWRVFQDKCAVCHGAAATGTANAPNLLARVGELSERRFVGLVLQRYDLSQPTVAPGPGAVTPAQVEVTMQRQDAPLVMPAWQGEPRVQAHIADLYAYLSARAQGRVEPGRPPQ
jgi:hypothetical protein